MVRENTRCVEFEVGTFPFSMRYRAINNSSPNYDIRSVIYTPL